MIIDMPSIRTKFSAERDSYQKAIPFPHIAIHGVFDDETLRKLSEEFPASERMGGSFTGEIEGGKFTESDWEKFGPLTQEFVSACNSGPFLKALENLTGITGLIPDPFLAGGGQHQSGRGARLKVHSDFNVHPFLNLTRRLNMLVYLNKDWDPSWGGQLELWNQEMTEAVVSVVPELDQWLFLTPQIRRFMDCPTLLGVRPNECDVHWLFTISLLMHLHQILEALSGKSALGKISSAGLRPG